MFKIELLQDCGADQGFDALGRITIGEFSEKFGIVAIDGDVEKVRDSWYVQLRRLINGVSVVALRTQPMFAWILYKEDEDVFIQQILICEGWQGTIDGDGRIVSIPPRTTTTEDGEKVSEWHTRASEIQLFLDQRIESI